MSYRARIRLGGFVALLVASVAHGWVTSFPDGAIIALRVTASGDVVAAGAPGIVKVSGTDGSVLWEAAVPYGAGSVPASGGPLIALDGAGDVLVAGSTV